MSLETRKIKKKKRKKNEKKDASLFKNRKKKKMMIEFLILCLELKGQIFGKEKNIPVS